MHNMLHKASNIIIGACGILVDATLALAALDAADGFLLHPTPTPGLVLLDADERFCLIDCSREVLVSNFDVARLLEPDEQIVDFCGSKVAVFELCVITNRRIIIGLILLDDFKLIAEVPLRANSVSPFQTGYLLNGLTGLHYLHGGGREWLIDEFFAHDGAAEFRTDGGVVVVQMPLCGERKKMAAGCRIVRVVGGRDFGLKHTIPELWDVAGGFLVALHSGGVMSFTALDSQVGRRGTVWTPERMQESQWTWLFAGIDKEQATIGIFVIAPNQARVMTMPLAALQGTEKPMFDCLNVAPSEARSDK
jgi:hypothetical protein